MLLSFKQVFNVRFWKLNINVKSLLSVFTSYYDASVSFNISGSGPYFNSSKDPNPNPDSQNKVFKPNFDALSNRELVLSLEAVLNSDISIFKEFS